MMPARDKPDYHVGDGAATGRWELGVISAASDAWKQLAATQLKLTVELLKDTSESTYRITAA